MSWELLFVIMLASFVTSYLGASVGLVLGQIRLPLLVVLTGSPIIGAATSLAISAAGALVGALRHAQEGRVDARLILTFGMPSAIGAFVMARWLALVDPRLWHVVIGAGLVLSGLVLGRGRRDREAEEAEPTARARPLLELMLGGALGSLASAVGLLLGSLRLPLLLHVLRTPASRAVGTNMAIGCLTGCWGAAGALTRGHIDGVAFLAVGAATMLGAHFGARITGRLPAPVLRRIIAWVVVLVGVGMIAQAL